MEKEKSRNTKPNEPKGVIEPNYSRSGVLLKDDKDRKEEAANKAKDRKQAKEIEKNQQKEKEKEKEKEIQKRQEEIEQLRERQKLPSDDLTDVDINRIFTEKSVGVSIKPNNYTKIFTTGEGDVKNTVYFPFYLLNSRITKKYSGKSNFVKDVKRKIYDISGLTGDEFTDIFTRCSKDTTIQKFLSENFKDNAKKCFKESSANFQDLNVYKFTPAGSLNNKDRIAFVKSGNVIIVLDFLGHIDGGEK